MDLTIPYTFYPSAPPHWIAWTLLGLAVLGGPASGVARGLHRGWLRGLRARVLGTLGLLAATVVASMVITFLVHDA